MNKKWMTLICAVMFILGTVVSWGFLSTLYESQLADSQLKTSLCESKLSNLQQHYVLKLRYDPSDVQTSYLIDGVFNVTFTGIEEYLIIGNITNLTYSTISEVVLFMIPRYPDGSLGSLLALIGETVEVLESHQTKEFTLVGTLEENQPFDLLLIY